jgi:hypothetical protein
MRIPKAIGPVFSSDACLEFHDRMEMLAKHLFFSHTMVGFNYDWQGIQSTKLYYVYNANGDEEFEFPVPELSDLYRSHIKQASLKSLSARLAPGAGITFTIKFDAAMQPSYGYFFRIDSDGQSFAENIISCYPRMDLSISDFEPGFGQYVMLDRDGIRESCYAYLENTERLWSLERKYGIKFSRCNSVEISDAQKPDTSSHKFIAIGLAEVFGSTFERGPLADIEYFFRVIDCEPCCAAVNPEKEMRSTYYIGRLRNKAFSCSPIHRILAQSGLQGPWQP